MARLLALQKGAQNAKSCSKVGERNLFMPISGSIRKTRRVKLIQIKFMHLVIYSSVVKRLLVHTALRAGLMIHSFADDVTGSD